MGATLLFLLPKRRAHVQDDVEVFLFLFENGALVNGHWGFLP